MKLNLREQMEKLRGVKQYQTGITLIALVITIVVLLILAGVGINTLFNDNGIINSASKSGDKYKMEAVREQIEAERVNWEAERVVDNTKKVEDFFDALEKADIIDSAKEDVGEPETTTEGENEITKYEITTKEGYIVEVIITKKPDGSTTITIGDIEESKNPLPKIKISEIKGTDNSITVKVQVSRMEKGELTYLYKLHDVEEWIELKKTTERGAEITGLEKGKIYDVKVIAKNENGGKEANKSIRTGELETGTITSSMPTWSNGTASITLSTTSNFDIQYQINSLSDNGWRNYTSAGITGIENNTTVYARLTDGVNYGEEASISVKDDIIPQVATVTFSTTIATVNKEMTATVTLKDNESGIDLSRSKWIFNQTSTAIGTAESSYINTFTSETETIKMTPTAAGNWYLHVLSTDNGGNVRETVRGAVKVEISPEDYTWTQSKTIVTGTPKAGGNKITREVGEEFLYDCGVSSYTGKWGILGAENGKLLIMSTVDIGKLQLSGKSGYNTGVNQLNNKCKPYGTNARSIKVEDINRVTGYNPYSTGDGKKYAAGSWGEYGSSVTYTASKTINSNGLTYTSELINGKYEHPDGRLIGTGGNTSSITVTSTAYMYYPYSLTTSSATTGTCKGIGTTSKAYKLLFRNAEDSAYCSYLLASSYVIASSVYSGFGLHWVDLSGTVNYYDFWLSYGQDYDSSFGVRAVVSL